MIDSIIEKNEFEGKNHDEGALWLLRWGKRYVVNGATEMQLYPPPGSILMNARGFNCFSKHKNDIELVLISL